MSLSTECAAALLSFRYASLQIEEANYTCKEQWEKNMVRGEGWERTGRMSESLQLSDTITAHSLWTGWKEGWRRIWRRQDGSRPFFRVNSLWQLWTGWKGGRRRVWRRQDGSRPFFRFNSQAHHAGDLCPPHFVPLFHDKRPNGDPKRVARTVDVVEKASPIAKCAYLDKKKSEGASCNTGNITSKGLVPPFLLERKSRRSSETLRRWLIYGDFLFYSFSRQTQANVQNIVESVVIYNA